jgi:hypothetical protein
VLWLLDTNLEGVLRILDTELDSVYYIFDTKLNKGRDVTCKLLVCQNVSGETGQEKRELVRRAFPEGRSLTGCASTSFPTMSSCNPSVAPILSVLAWEGLF